MINRHLLFFFQHSLSEYNLDLFKNIQKIESFKVTFFFDSDVKKISDTLQAVVYKPVGGMWLWRDRPIELYCSLKFLLQVIRKRPQIIVSEDGGNIFNNIILSLLKPFLRYKLILWGLGDIPNRKPSIYKKVAWPFIKIIWRKSDAIISYSTYGKEVYVYNGVSPDRIFVAHNAIALGNVTSRIEHYQKFSQLKEKIDGRKVIVFVGRLDPTKCVDDLLYAFKRMLKIHGNSILFIVGDGKQRGFLEKIAEKEDLSACCFEGARNINDVSEYLAFADICVVPGEGGLVINHALSHGVPVIVSTGDGTEFDLIKHGENGYFFKRHDIQDLSQKMIAALDSKTLKSYAERHKIDVPTVQQMLDVFNHVFSYTVNKNNRVLT